MRYGQIVSICMLVVFLAGCQSPKKITEKSPAKETEPLTRQAIWADPDAKVVFMENFQSPATNGLVLANPSKDPSDIHYNGISWRVRIFTLYSKDPSEIHYNGILQGGGHDGRDCFLIDFNSPAKSVQQLNFSMPATDPAGIYYRLYLKVETEPAIEKNKPLFQIGQPHGRGLHSIYYSQSLEEEWIKTGEWLEKAGKLWTRHLDYLHNGWVMYEGDTANFFMQRHAGKKSDDPFTEIKLRFHNTNDFPVRLRVYLDDITVIRRDIFNLPEMKSVLETPRPVILHTRKQILLARERLGAPRAVIPESPYTAFIKNELKTAGNWLEKDIDVPEKQAGWPAAYYCTVEDCKGGGQLWPDPPHGYVCRKCGKKYTGKQWDQLLVRLRHQDLSNAAKALGFAWQWTDDERYARKAEEILLAYAGSIDKFTLGHNWLGDCWLMENFLCGYDYIYENVSGEKRRAINKFLMTMVKRIYHYNHHYPEGYTRLWMTCSWAALLTKDRDWIHYLLFSRTGNRNVILRYGLTSDMVSLKGPNYHALIVLGISRVGLTMENCGVRFFDSEVRGIYDALPHQTFPDQQTASGADGCGMDIAYRYYRDPVYLALLSDRFVTNRSSRLFWEDYHELPAREGLRLPSSNLSSLGLTLLRTQPDNDAVLAFNWGAPKRNDPANLDFRFYGAGAHLIRGTGIAGYADPFYGRWYTKSISRNGLVVDEGTQVPVSAKLLFLQKDAPEQVVSAELIDAYPDTRWVRTFVMFANGEVVLIDMLGAKGKRTIDSVLHLHGKVTADVPLTQIKAPPGKANGYDVLENVQAGDGSQPFAIVLKSGRLPGSDEGVKLISAPVDGTSFYLAVASKGASGSSPLALLRREGVSRTVYATLLQPFKTAPSATGRVRVADVQYDENTRRFPRVTIDVETVLKKYKLIIKDKPGGLSVAVQK